MKAFEEEGGPVSLQVGSTGLRVVGMGLVLDCRYGVGLRKELRVFRFRI